MQHKILPVILCGGSGTRLLPVLKYNSPKQFLNILCGRYNLLQNTLMRFVNHSNFEKPVVIGKLAHKESLIQSLQDIDTSIETLILEPEGKNTGPAIASVISYLQESHWDDNTIIMVTPIDHYISNQNKFIRKLNEVVKLINSGYFDEKIFTLFVNKTSSEKNYGHLKLGKKISCNILNDLFEIENFIEKPDSENVVSNTVWNSGIYCMKIKACKKIIQRNAPYILHYSYKAVTESVQRNVNSLMKSEIILNHEHFKKNSSLSFDQILTMPFHKHSLFGSDIGTKWEDIGIWSGIQRLCNDPSQSQIINMDLFAEKRVL